MGRLTFAGTADVLGWHNASVFPSLCQAGGTCFFSFVSLRAQCLPKWRKGTGVVQGEIRGPEESLC